MTYLDPHEPDPPFQKQRAAKQEATERRWREAAGQETFDDLVLKREPKYNGTPAQLRRLAARAGRPVRQFIEDAPTDKTGT